MWLKLTRCRRRERLTNAKHWYDSYIYFSVFTEYDETKILVHWVEHAIYYCVLYSTNTRKLDIHKQQPHMLCVLRFNLDAIASWRSRRSRGFPRPQSTAVVVCTESIGKYFRDRREHVSLKRIHAGGKHVDCGAIMINLPGTYKSITKTHTRYCAKGTTKVNHYVFVNCKKCHQSVIEMLCIANY